MVGEQLPGRHLGGSNRNLALAAMPALAWSAVGKSQQNCSDSWHQSHRLKPERSELEAEELATRP
jgi:hypothetical protein